MSDMKCGCVVSAVTDLLLEHNCKYLALKNHCERAISALWELVEYERSTHLISQGGEGFNPTLKKLIDDAKVALKEAETFKTRTDR